MFRKLQLASYKLLKLWNHREYNDEELIYYFGPPPYEFIYQIENPIPYANKFGSYGKQLNDIALKYDDIPLEFKYIIQINDIGKFIDNKKREYIGGFEPNEFTVRLPKAKSNERSEIPFPEVGEKIFLEKRDIYLTVKITDIGNIRKATAGLRVKFLD